jgi:hypothetical protein
MENKTLITSSYTYLIQIFDNGTQFYFECICDVPEMLKVKEYYTIMEFPTKKNREDFIKVLECHPMRYVYATTERPTEESDNFEEIDLHIHLN